MVGDFNLAKEFILFFSCSDSEKLLICGEFKFIYFCYCLKILFRLLLLFLLGSKVNNEGNFKVSVFLKRLV